MDYISPYQKALSHLRQTNGGNLSEDEVNLFNSAKSSGYSEEQATQILASAKMRKEDQELAQQYQSYKESPSDFFTTFKSKYDDEGGPVGKTIGFVKNFFVDAGESVRDIAQFAGTTMAHGFDYASAPFRSDVSVGGLLSQDAQMASQMPKAVVTALKENFGSIEAAKKTFYENPFDVISTILPVVGLAGKVTATSKIASVAKVGDALQKVGDVANLSKLKVAKDFSAMSTSEKALNTLSKLGDLTNFDINTVKMLAKTPAAMMKGIGSAGGKLGFGNFEAFGKIAEGAKSAETSALQKAYSGMDTTETSKYISDQFSGVKKGLNQELDPLEAAARANPVPVSKVPDLKFGVNEDARIKNLGLKIVDDGGNPKIVINQETGTGVNPEQIKNANEKISEIYKRVYPQGASGKFDFGKIDNFRDALEREMIDPSSKANPLIKDVFSPLSEHLKKLQGQVFPEIKKQWGKIEEYHKIEDVLRESIGEKITKNMTTGEEIVEKVPPNYNRLVSLVKRDREGFAKTVEYVKKASGGKLDLEQLAYAIQGKEWFSNNNFLANIFRTAGTAAGGAVGGFAFGNRIAALVGAVATGGMTSSKVLYNLARAYGKGALKMEELKKFVGKGVTLEDLKSVLSNKNILSDLKDLSVKDVFNVGKNVFTMPVGAMNSKGGRIFERIGNKLLEEVGQNQGQENIQNKRSELAKQRGEIEQGINTPKTQGQPEKQQETGIDEYPDNLGVGN